MEQFIEGLEEILELDTGSLKEETDLKTLEEWDSLAKISFLAYAEDAYSRNLTGEDLVSCITVKDLHQLMTSPSIL